MFETGTSLKPLWVDLKKIEFGSFLVSNDFTRLMVEKNHVSKWEAKNQYFENSITHYPNSVNYRIYHAELAFISLLDDLITESGTYVYDFLYFTLDCFFRKKAITSEQFEDLEKDLRLIKLPISKIYLLGSLVQKNNLGEQETPKLIKIGTMQSHKIFISHASKDLEIVNYFVDQVLRLGLGISNEQIFCTSLEGMGIRTGKEFREEIKNKITDSELVLIMLSKNYKESEICLNEMGAAWVLGKTIIPILLPSISLKEVGILQITNTIAQINTGPGIDNINHAIRETLNFKTNADIRIWNKHRTVFLKLFDVEKNEEKENSNNEIQLIKKEFVINDNIVANIIWHLGSYEKTYRTQDTLSKKTGLTYNQIDEIVRIYPTILYRGKGKLGFPVYKLQDLAKDQFLKIPFKDKKY